MKVLLCSSMLFCVATVAFLPGTTACRLLLQEVVDGVPPIDGKPPLPHVTQQGITPAATVANVREC